MRYLIFFELILLLLKLIPLYTQETLNIYEPYGDTIYVPEFEVLVPYDAISNIDIIQ